MATERGVDSEVLGGTIDAAIEALLRVRLALAPVEDIDVPAAALDGALQLDHGHAVARSNFEQALVSLRTATPPSENGLLLAVEDAANELAGRAADVGYRLGVGHRVRTTPP